MKTPTKAEEIHLLQTLIVQTREAGAGYLYDALVSLAVPFEDCVRSDFPGEMAAHRLIEAAREARKDLQKLTLEISTARETLRKTQEETAQAVREAARAKNDLAECRAIARRLANA
jgi:hypothetical protein